MPTETRDYPEYFILMRFFRNSTTKRLDNFNSLLCIVSTCPDFYLTFLWRSPKENLSNYLIIQEKMDKTQVMFNFASTGGAQRGVPPPIFQQKIINPHCHPRLSDVRFNTVLSRRLNKICRGGCHNCIVSKDSIRVNQI